MARVGASATSGRRLNTKPAEASRVGLAGSDGTATLGPALRSGAGAANVAANDGLDALKAKEGVMDKKKSTKARKSAKSRGKFKDLDAKDAKTVKGGGYITTTNIKTTTTNQG